MKHWNELIIESEVNITGKGLVLTTNLKRNGLTDSDWVDDVLINKANLDLSLLSVVDNTSDANPLVHMRFDKPRILYTMWESTRINDLLIEILNKFTCIIVPNHYNKKNLINQGCSTRIEVVPLFCNTEHP